MAIARVPVSLLALLFALFTLFIALASFIKMFSVLAYIDMPLSFVTSIALGFHALRFNIRNKMDIYPFIVAFLGLFVSCAHLLTKSHPWLS
ncbi:MAG: hypothetical protein ACI84O_001233 [Myxococcota bacterium]|jgi:hypothetical protein